MASATYLGVVEKGDHGFGVFFPDLPGCVSAGETVLEAMANGEEAIAAHVELLAHDGDEIPRPSADVDVDSDIEVACYFLAHVDLPGKAVRLNITMDEGLVARIDRIAKNRSAFLAEAARDALARQRELADA